MGKLSHSSNANLWRINVEVFEIHRLAFSIGADAFTRIQMRNHCFNVPDNFSTHGQWLAEKLNKI